MFPFDAHKFRRCAQTGLTRCEPLILPMPEQDEPQSTTDAIGSPSQPASKRRRRRRQAPVEEIITPAHAAAGDKPSPARPGRWQRWRREVFVNLGVSPLFRAYIFLGSIVAILAFLLYNESLIAELREHEKSRVDLYAHLISFVPLASEKQAATIFTEVINNPKVDFPRIITNHRGEIIQASGIQSADLGDSTGTVTRFFEGLAFWMEREAALVDTGSVSTAELYRLIEEMDSQNSPISFHLSQEAAGLLYADMRFAVITDTQGEIVKWRGKGLPSSEDTTAAALIQVQLVLQGMDTAAPLSFSVPVAGYSHLHWDGANAVIVNGQGEVEAWYGDRLPTGDDAVARDLVRAFVAERSEVSEPLAFRIPAEQYIHYGNTDLVDRISFASLVQIGVLLLFIIVGYIGYRNIKRSEQRSIWVGMAKETAHQLGTPLSSLAGWLELIRHEVEAVPVAGRDARLAYIDQMVGEMQQDMHHLDQVASRFSQIGSVPELKENDVISVVEEIIDYFKSRGPQFGRHEITVERRDELPPIPINAELISWAFENLFKNAIDAMDRQTGSIHIRIGLMPEGQAVQISFQDDGRGIEPENIKRVFDPGFSTKKRGWGLGLAFVKRIVEEYHKGKISVVQSAPGAGTTFEVILPLGKGAKRGT